MRCGNPCALCCLNLPNGCKRVCIFQLIYHGVCFCIYLGILSAIVVKAVQKMMPAETFVETYWEYTALTSIHGLHLIIWIPLYFAVKYRYPPLLLTWFILTLVLMVSQLICLILGRNALLGQIPLIIFDAYCLWVVMAFRLFLIFMRDGHEDIPMLPAIQARPVCSFQDRADGDIPLTEKNSTNERFGYCVHIYSSSGYVQIPRIAFERQAAQGSKSIDEGYYKRCYYCPNAPSSEDQQSPGSRNNIKTNLSHSDRIKATEGAITVGLNKYSRTQLRGQNLSGIMQSSKTHDMKNLKSPLYNK
ncbi:unnamed protein product [Allacma fusca]|uniref:Uncharacterized protein n=1 Tax=Allacma fusca TaxID=39272 RepID=A0A8J2JYI9_9HEXA|nr:unnamed protein product [Allacma fusca]